MKLSLKVRIANWVVSYLWGDISANLQTQLSSTTHKALVERNNYLKDIIVNTNTIATKLTVTNHACDRYIERIEPKITRKYAREKLYLGVIEASTNMDKITNGKYNISRNVIAVVDDQKVITVYRI